MTRQKQQEEQLLWKKASEEANAKIAEQNRAHAAMIQKVKDDAEGEKRKAEERRKHLES